MNNKSDTPRTDTALKPLIARGVSCTGEEALLGFTRQLERELATANELLGIMTRYRYDDDTFLDAQYEARKLLEGGSE